MSYITGEIVMLSHKYVPSGFLVCDGSEVSRTEYAALFAVLGITYGFGDGSTTFNLPDLRSYFVRFQSDGTGVDPNAATRAARPDGTSGDVVGTTQYSTVATHSHSYTTYRTTASYGQYIKETDPSWGPSVSNMMSFYRTKQTTYSETRPENIYVMGVIKI